MHVSTSAPSSERNADGASAGKQALTSALYRSQRASKHRPTPPPSFCPLPSLIFPLQVPLPTCPFFATNARVFSGHLSPPLFPGLPTFFVLQMHHGVPVQPLTKQARGPAVALCNLCVRQSRCLPGKLLCSNVPFCVIKVNRFTFEQFGYDQGYEVS